MLQHIQYELIQDLYKKLYLYKNNTFEKDHIYDFKNNDAQIVSKILIKSKLNFQLDKETINSFLSGKRKVKNLSTNDEINIQSSVTLDELENFSLILSLLTFIHSFYLSSSKPFLYKIRAVTMAIKAPTGTKTDTELAREGTRINNRHIKTNGAIAIFQFLLT